MPEDNYGRFSERARKVLSLAQAEAWRFNHSYIGTEHLLLGLVRDGGGIASKVLRDMGVQLSVTRSAIESIVGRGSEMVVGEISLTPGTRRVIKHAVDEAERLNHHYIGTEHLLLGLLQESEGIAYAVLASLGVRPKQIRDQVLGMMMQPYVLHEGPGESEINQDMKPAPFSQAAQKVLSLAHQEARQFHHSRIDSEHLLLGLLTEDGGVAAKVLRELGVEYPQARQIVESLADHGESAEPGVVGLSSRGRVVIDLAVVEARRMHHHEVGTEHLLLGVTRDGGGLASGVFRRLGIDPEEVRRRVFEAMGATEPPVAQEKFVRFSERARKVLSLAQAEAWRFNHSYIDTEHLLLGLAREDDGVAARVLRESGILLPEVRAAIESRIAGESEIVVGETGLTPNARRVIESAVDEAHRLDHQEVGPEHLLLGLLRERDGIAFRVLVELGGVPPRISDRVYVALGRPELQGSGRIFPPKTDRSRSSSVSSGPGTPNPRRRRLFRKLEELGGLSFEVRVSPFDIHHILREMPPQEREALVLGVCAEASAVDIAAILDMSTPDAESLLDRAKTDFQGRYRSAMGRRAPVQRVLQVVRTIFPRDFGVASHHEHWVKVYLQPGGDSGDADFQRIYNVLRLWLLPPGTASDDDSDQGLITTGEDPDGTKWILIDWSLLTASQ